MAGIPQVITEDRASGAQFIEGSLKFDQNKRQYLTRTPTTDGNRRLWTWSGWLKRNPPNLQDIFSAGQESTNDGIYSRLRIHNDSINLRQWVNGSLDSSLITHMKLRDTSAFFHFVMIYDVDNSTNTDKVRWYINGQRVTSLSATDYPGNSSWINSSSKTHTIGGHYDGGGANADSFWDGNMSQVYFLDGIAAGPEEFGYTDPLTNTWRPKKFEHLSTSIATQYSGASALTWDDNPIGSIYTLSNGNKTATASGGSGYTGADVWSNAIPADSTTAWTLEITNSDSVGGWYFADAQTASGTHPDERGGNSLGLRNQEATTGYYGTFASANGGSNGQDKISMPGCETFGSRRVDFVVYRPASGTGKVWVKPNGGSAWIGGGDPSNTSSTPSFIIPDGNTYFGYTFYDRNNGDQIATLDGDGSIQQKIGANSFYLPLDGNTPIGEDQSGNGNNWEPVNFGGSVTLDKATGAIPILNTDAGGTIATGGVRTDSKTYTVTASGGKYYLDGVETPTLNFLRGGTYIFDYTGATSHPFKFSTTSDGTHNSGSEYTDGTNTATTNVMKITVPHNAPDTLYYYCSAHSGMGSSINVTTDILKADPYAWKNVFSLPLERIIDDVSYQINCNSTKKTATGYSATASSAQSNFYRGSYNFDGTGDKIKSTTSSDLVFGTSDFTVEAWVYKLDTSDALFLGQTDNDAGGRKGIALGYHSERLWVLQGNGASWSLETQVGSFARNKWVHVAVSRDYSDSKTRYFVDGQLVYTYTSNVNLSADNNNHLTIGSIDTDSLDWDGYIQDFRIYKGVAKYTENFFVGSPNPDVLPDTPSGITGKTNLTKITKSATGGAVSFPGTTDYILTTDSADFEFGGSTDFTIEAYVNPTGAPGGSGYNCIFAKGESLQFYYMSTGSLTIYASTNYSSNGYNILNGNGPAAGSVSRNKWHHIAVCRSGGTEWKIYVDGIEKWNASAGGSIEDNSYGFSIGAYGPSPSSYEFEGFISNFRIIKGTALYTSNFTPPAAPLTNVTNTKLLCCQSNLFAGAATVSPSLGGINDGTVWSDYVTGDIDSNYPAWRAFRNDTSSVGCRTQTANGATIVWQPPSPIAFSSSFKIWAARDGTHAGTTFTVTHAGGDTNFTSSVVTSTTQTAVDLAQISGVTSPITKITIVSGGPNPRFSGIEVDTTMLINPVSPIGSVVATNFNKLNTDINTVRGKETGYATFNPLDKNGGAALSDGNLKIQTYSNVWKNTPTTIGMKTGKFYCEFGPNLWTDNNNHCQPGVRSMALGNTFEMGATNYTGFYHYTGTTLFNGQGGAGTAFGSAWNDNSYNIIGVAFDADTRKVWFSKNGMWQGGGNPSAGTNEAGIINPIGDDGSYAFGLGTHGNGGLPNGGAEANFGQKPFKYAPPDGFQPLNLPSVQPEKVIARPDQYVGVSLWSGNGTSQNVTGLKHKPDFVWIKKRAGGSARSHQLFDSVRGVYKTLHSDSANAQDTNTNRLTAFNQDGFAVGGDDGCNGSSGTFVGWTWKAGGSKGQFNIDDVGYANASDVNMNVAGLNSSLYDSSQTWSSFGSSGTYSSTYDWTKMFAGDMANARTIPANGQSITADFSSLSGGGIAYTSSFKLYYNRNSSAPDVTVNGSGISATADGTDRVYELTGSGLITSVGTTQRTAAGNGDCSLKKIEIDGKILLDNGVTPVDNFPSIAATGCSVGTKQGFSIIKYTSNLTQGATISHGLTQKPDFAIFKNLDSNLGINEVDWGVYHSSLGATKNLELNQNLAEGTYPGPFNNTEPTSSVFTFGGSPNAFGHSYLTNGPSGDDFIAYIWHDVPGLQKFGKWTNNNSNDGTFIELGFKPAVLLLKNIDNIEQWYIIDGTRYPNNLGPGSSTLVASQPSSNKTEADTAGQASSAGVDFLSNGFKIRSTNTSGGEISFQTRNYIYAAWAEAPSINLYGAQANAR